MKRGMLAAVLAAALLLGGCGGGSGDSTPATKEAAEQMQVLYDKEALDPDCAAVTERYFQAIQDQDFDAYKACIFPVYYEHMEQMLQTNYQYGMEQSFRKRCAGFLGEGHTSYQITSLQSGGIPGQLFFLHGKHIRGGISEGYPGRHGGEPCDPVHAEGKIRQRR